jgi:hypothetical protein
MLSMLAEGSYERDNCSSGEEGNRSIDENGMRTKGKRSHVGNDDGFVEFF